MEMLQAIAADIRDGRQVAYDEATINRIRELMEEMNSVSDLDLWLWFLRFLAPGILLIGLLALAYYAISWLSRS